MKGYLIIEYKDRSRVYPCLISKDPVRNCKRLSWFTMETGYSWQSENGKILEKSCLKPAGHIYFKKNPSIKHLVKVLSTHQFLKRERIDQKRVKIIVD